MRLWPFYSITFETSLAPPEALRLLHAEIGPSGFDMLVGPISATVKSSADRRLFLGTAHPDGADFQNNLNGEPGELKQFNGFQASVRARLAPTARGTEVRASFHLLGCVIAPLLVFLFIPLMTLTVEAIRQVLTGGPMPFWTIFVGPAFMAGLWLFVCASFSEDADTAERMLRATLERD